MIELRVFVQQMDDFFLSEIRTLTENVMNGVTHEDYLAQVGMVNALHKSRASLHATFKQMMAQSK